MTVGSGCQRRLSEARRLQESLRVDYVRGLSVSEACRYRYNRQIIIIIIYFMYIFNLRCFIKKEKV